MSSNLPHDLNRFFETNVSVGNVYKSFTGKLDSKKEIREKRSVIDRDTCKRQVGRVVLGERCKRIKKNSEIVELLSHKLGIFVPVCSNF